MLCVGRLAAEKNLELALLAFEAIRREQPRARLVLVGEGPLCDALAQRAPYLHFAGPRRGVDLAAHYASADLFLFPSPTGASGDPTAQALASALPVVALDHAAAAPLIRPGIEGMLVPCGNADEFVRAMLQNARSAAHHRALGERARQRALQHDWKAVIARFEFELMRASLQTEAPPWRGAGIASALP